MKINIYKPVLLFVFFIFCSKLFGQCPLTAQCSQGGNNGIFFTYEGNYPDPFTLDLFFGSNHPANGTYTSVNQVAGGGSVTYARFPMISCYTLGSNGFSVQINNSCVIHQGAICNDCGLNNGQPFSTCNELYTNCGFDWEVFLSEYKNQILCRQWEGAESGDTDGCGSHLMIKRKGKVSIGTEGTSSQKLTVKGGIISDKVKVTCYDVNDWCDYVFEEDYDLKSLQEVEVHIKEKRHLHNTPSGEEIEKEGSFELKSVTVDHQEKIEEIFLHLIEMKKEAASLEERLAELKKENKALKNK